MNEKTFNQILDELNAIEISIDSIRMESKKNDLFEALMARCPPSSGKPR